MKIQIKDKNIELRQTLRSHIIFENVTGHSFKGTGLGELAVFFYCTVMACCPNLEMEYEAFIDWLDEDIERLKVFSEWMVSADQTQHDLSPKPEGEIPAPDDGAKKKE